MVPRRRSIAARARSLASRRSSGAAAVSAGGAATGAATCGEVILATGFSRGGDGLRRVSTSAGMLAVSVGLSADFSAEGFSIAAAGPSDTVFSIIARSEIPLALTPGWGILAMSDEVLGRLGLAAGIGFLRIGRGYRRGHRRFGRPGRNVVVYDVGADDGRSHRRQDIHREFLQVIQHNRPLPARSDAGTLRHIEGSTATDRWQTGK